MPDDTYTPDDEEVRAEWVGGMSTLDKANGYLYPMDATEADAAFDRFIARVKAEALRDAAQNMDEWNVEAIVVTGEEDDEDTWQEWTVADWLTDRADTIEKEAGA